MELIGYSLVKNGKEIQKFGDTKGQQYGKPPVLTLSNGNQVMGFKVGDTFNDGSKLVERWLNDNPPEPYFLKGERIILFDVF